MTQLILPACGLTTASGAYKPMRYPQAYNFWKRQQQLHWLQSEVRMDPDVRDWKSLDPRMRGVCGGIFKNFTQADIDVQHNYHAVYQKIFAPTEVNMMLTAFSNMETVHIDAYSSLLETLGLPDDEYMSFLEYEEMKAKHDFLHSFNPTNPEEVAMSLAGVSSCGEGLMLFASFAMLLNLPRNNLMKGMGQIVSWSVRDESLHCEGIAWLYHQWMRENAAHIDREKHNRGVNVMVQEAVGMEDAFIDLVHKDGDMPGATREEFKAYVRYIADIRMGQLGLPGIYGIRRNPIPWVDGLQAGVEHANFFEQQATEYSRGATKGAWSDAF